MVGANDVEPCPRGPFVMASIGETRVASSDEREVMDS